MATVFALAVPALLVYILWRLLHRGRSKVDGAHAEPHRNFKLRWATALLVLFFLLFGVTSDSEKATLRGGNEPQTPTQQVVDSAPPQTSPAELAEQRAAAKAAKEEAEREIRRAVAARKAANRAKARRERAVRERKAANRAKARAENEARRAREAEAAAAAEAATPVYDDDDAAGSGDPYLEMYNGMRCYEIPESDFPTPPGDPMGWDRDNDGVSCES